MPHLRLRLESKSLVRGQRQSVSSWFFASCSPLAPHPVPQLTPDPLGAVPRDTSPAHPNNESTASSDLCGLGLRVAFLTWYFTLEILKETKMQRSVGSVSCNTYFAAAAAAKLLQLCLTLCDPTDGSLFWGITVCQALGVNQFWG